MIGEKFARLTVVAERGIRNHKRMWECRCECGGVTVAATGQLRSGGTKSCGCLKRDIQTKHGMWKSRTYSIWNAMLNRCRQAQHKKYYADIGICERWRQFENFLTDMGEAPEGMSIDRIDNAKGYSPDNCRWATQRTQVRNTRRRTEYEYKGERKSLIEWAETLGMSFEMLRGRIRRGWSFHDAIRSDPGQ